MLVIPPVVDWSDQLAVPYATQRGTSRALAPEGSRSGFVSEEESLGDLVFHQGQGTIARSRELAHERLASVSSLTTTARSTSTREANFGADRDRKATDQGEGTPAGRELEGDGAEGALRRRGVSHRARAMHGASRRALPPTRSDGADGEKPA